MRGDVAPDVPAPGGHLPHGAGHEGHQLGDEVDEAAVVDLPEDEVELPDVLVVLGVGVQAPRNVAEVAFENIAASLKEGNKI